MTTTCTVVATVTIADHADPEIIRGAVVEALDRIGAVLIPCDWSPDPDTIADCVGSDVAVRVIDLNPARV